MCVHHLPPPPRHAAPSCAATAPRRAAPRRATPACLPARPPTRARGLAALQLPGEDHLFCRYSLHYGPDWQLVQGAERGFSQVASKGGAAGRGRVVWALPLEATFRSTSAAGWPRLALAVYAQDWAGRYVVRGYGSALLPTVPGRRVRAARLFVPEASSLLQAALGWLAGAPPEFYDAGFAAAADGRELTRVAPTGAAVVAMHVLTRGMAAHGFCTGGPPDLADAESEGAWAGVGRRGTARRSARRARKRHLRGAPAHAPLARSTAGLDGQWRCRRGGSGGGCDGQRRRPGQRCRHPCR